MVDYMVAQAIDRLTQATQKAGTDIRIGLEDMATAIREHTTALEALAEQELGVDPGPGPDYDETD